MKQTAVDLIFENFNLRSDKDFKTWMLHTYDYLKRMEKEQIMDAYKSGINCISDADADFYYTINYKSFYPEK